MAKKYISAVIVMVMALGICTVSMAQEKAHGTATELRSKGAIVYQKGNDSVVIDSKDLYTLADKLDYFKTAAARQLEAVHTYFTPEKRGTQLTTDEHVNVVHTEPADATDPLTLDFDTILEGIAASQSIPLDPSEYGYEAGSRLYKTKDGKLTTDASGEGATEINITAATADNLSAGTAAWVNGELLLGSGADNQAYCNSHSASGMLDSITKVENPCTLEKGTYMYIICNASYTSYRNLYYIPKVSITGEAVNTISEVTQYQSVTNGSDKTHQVYLGYSVYYIDVAEESAVVDITLNASTQCAHNTSHRFCVKLE